MACEGLITNVDKTLGYCELDNKNIVFLSILKLINSDFKLPDKPGKLSVKKVLSPLQNYYICTESSTVEIVSQTSTDFESSKFINFLKNNNNYVIEILNSACKITTILKKYFIITEEKLEQQIILRVLEELHHINKTNFALLKSVHECKSLKLLTTECSSSPTWSFGIQTEDKQILFGNLFISPLHGCFFLQDSNHKFRLILPNTCFKDLSRFDRTYVLLKKYKTFTEISNNPNVPDLKYLYVELDDIIVVGSKKRNINLLGTTTTNQKYNNVLKFCLVRKSSVWIGSNLEPEYYLEIAESNTDISHEYIHLTLPLSYIPIFLHLKEENEYALFYNELKPMRDRGVQFVKNYKYFLLADKNAYFQELNVTKKYSFKRDVLTVKQCKDVILYQTNMINFQGVVTKKSNCRRLASRISKRPTNMCDFGTPGSQTYQVTFKFKDSDGSLKFLDCYISDWDNVLNPIGLIPEMRVLVKNVLPQSKKYLKPTIFTSFEIISYEPVVEFNTPILNCGIEELTWGKPFFLGLGENLPDDVIVWGTISNFYVTKIEMTNHCKICESVANIEGPCLKCGCSERTMKFYLIMQVSDQYEEVRIVAKDPKILKNILNLPSNQFDTWLENFSQLGSFNFNIFEGSRYRTGSSDENFKVILTKLLLCVNKSLQELEIKCRRNISKRGGFIVYDYLDSRRKTV